MESNTLSLLSPLATLRVLSSEKLAPTNCYILRSYNHFLKHFSSSTTNLKLGTPQAILNTSPIAPSEVTTPTLRELCQSHVPEHILQRMEEIGYVMPTDIQREALPYLFSGLDCILHAQVLGRHSHTCF